MPNNQNTIGLLEPDLAPHYSAWKQNPNPTNTNKIIKALDPTINSAVRTYSGALNPSPTIRSKAKLIMINALNSYNPAKAKLKTHMMSQLQGLRRFAAKESQILSIPEQVAIDLGKLNDAEVHLRDKFARDPSEAELADHMGVSMRRLAYIRNARPVYSEGFISGIQSNLGDSESLYHPQVEDIGASKAWHDFVYHDLDPIDQVIMEHSLGMHGKPTLTNLQIASKLKISPGAVSQRKSRIQDKLDTRDELGIF